VKFKIDENLPVEVCQLLRESRYEADTVWDENLQGKGDESIAEVCRREQRILITLDRDFSDIRHYPPEEYPGLIVLALISQDKPHVLEIMRRILVALQSQPLEKRLWIVEESRIRIRGG
jgi:predicted nuclease of predicted toxin-antitoxin system